MPGAFFTPEPKERSNGSFVVNTLLSGTLRSLMSAARSLADGLPPITRRTGCWRLRLRSIFSMQFTILLCHYNNLPLSQLF